MATRLDEDLILRRRQPEDDRYIEALSAGAFADYAHNGARAVKMLVREKGAITAVATLDAARGIGDEIVGFVIVSFERARTRFEGMGEPNVAHLSAIATDPMLLRRGIGRRLLAHAEQIARDGDAVCMSLTTGVMNARARALFGSSGYYALAGCADFYGRGRDAVFMHKPLVLV